MDRAALDGFVQPELLPGIVVLTSAEFEAIRHFIDQVKLKKHLEPTTDDGVATIEGRSVVDPGFLSALQKTRRATINRYDTAARR
jgi:hypothetical protein